MIPAAETVFPNETDNLPSNLPLPLLTPDRFRIFMQTTVTIAIADTCFLSCLSGNEILSSEFILHDVVLILNEINPIEKYKSLKNVSASGTVVRHTLLISTTTGSSSSSFVLIFNK